MCFRNEFRGLFVGLILVTAAETAVAQDMPGCTCDDEAILTAFRSADNLIYGEIRQASITSKDDPTVEIRLGSVEIIRGAFDESRPVITPRPDKCGIPAYIGARFVFATRNNVDVTSRCWSSALPHGSRWLFLHQALVTVNLWDTNPEAVRKTLNRFGSRMSPSYMAPYFDLIEALDPDADVQRSETEVRYRGLVFDFEDANYVLRWEN